MTVPTAAEIVAAAINLPHLAALYRQEQASGREPRLVLAPHGLDQSNWLSLYQNLQDDPAINTSGRIRNGDLFINEDIQTNWGGLTSAPTDVAIPKITDKDGHLWTLRIIPSTSKPTVMDVAHDGTDGTDTKGNKIIEPTHPTMNEYLSLQASLL